MEMNRTEFSFHSPLVTVRFLKKAYGLIELTPQL